MSIIGEAIKRLRENVARTCEKVSREPEEIEIVAITKGILTDAIKEAYENGLRTFGENRLQEALKKIPLLPDDIHWHFVGHLQTNKAKLAVRNFELIQSVDSLRLADLLSKIAMKEKSIVRVLIEVNSSGEESKYGFPLDSAFNSIKEIKNLPGIEVLGIMTIGPLTQDVYRIRESFRKTRELFEMLKQELNGNIKYLSMGMSDDYTIAIEEGSNMIRIGRAIFGERH